jgi:hypothetical protein
MKKRETKAAQKVVVPQIKISLASLPEPLEQEAPKLKTFKEAPCAIDSLLLSLSTRSASDRTVLDSSSLNEEYSEPVALPTLQRRPRIMVTEHECSAFFG